MTRETLELIAPDRKKHAAELYDLIGKVFSTGVAGYYGFRDLCRTNYIGHSHYDWAASRIGLLGGRIVTHYGVWGYDMRIGSATVRCGGIGAVATDADYRKRGLMAKTVVASIEAMRTCGYDVSILFGITNFYDKFGYVRAWSRISDAIGIDRLTKERPRHRVLKVSDLTREDIAAIYAHEHAGLTGTAVRPTYRAAGGAWKRWAGWRWVDKRGRTLGYVTGRPNDGTLECYEAGGDPDEAMRVLAMLARRHVCREVKFVDVHENTPILRKMRRGDCTTTVNSRRNGGPMIRTIHLASSLEKMRGELSRRLKRSPLATWRGALLVDDVREKVTLKIADGKVAVAAKPSKTKHVIRGGDAVAQLLIGTNEPAETVEAA
ncbi:MAG TPA: GNAT family N-acetyltransferase, partial [Planctomycetota bacterium]|nr:GNAT family N-acetyltransferase [Planctomycetota bacterium]